MLTKTYLLCIFVLLNGATVIETHFVGGTLNWREVKLRGKNIFRFTYRITWEKGYGPCGKSCSKSDITRKTSTSAFNIHKWQCSGGCGSKAAFGDLNYVITGVGDRPGWEQGEMTYTFSLPSNFVSKISIMFPAWFPTTKSKHNPKVTLMTHVDTNLRNDTQAVNASPLTSLPPYIGLQYGCISNISIPVEEPDKDFVRCRWAVPSECGQGCSDLPNSFLDETACVLYFNGTNKGNYLSGDTYRITLTIEDFPRTNILMGKNVKTPSDMLSSVSLQFVVHIVSSPHTCNTDMAFVQPSVANHYSVSFLPSPNPVSLPVYVSSPRNVDILPSYPAHMNWTILPDDGYPHGNIRNGVKRIANFWRPKPPEQVGDNIICVWAKDSDGVSSGPLCMLVKAYDFDECKGIQCMNGGSCVDLYGQATCRCPHSYKPPTCSSYMQCNDLPCLNNGKCIGVGKSIKCTCPHDFTGERCQTMINCFSYPCQNKGTCEQHTSGFRCICPTGFKGSYCEKSLNSTTNHAQMQQGTQKLSVHGNFDYETADFWTAVGGSIIAFVVCTVILFGAICWIKKKGRRSKTLPSELQ